MAPTDLILILIILMAGFVPPALLLILQRKLSRKTLDEAKGIRDDAFKKADDWQKEYMAEIVCLKQWVSDEMTKTRGGFTEEMSLFRSWISDEIKRNSEGIKADLLEDFEDRLKQFEDRQKEQLDGLDDHIEKVVNGTLGAFVKGVGQDIKNDPEVQDAYMVATYGEEEEKAQMQGRMADLLRRKIGQSLLKKMDKFIEGI